MLAGAFIFNFSLTWAAFGEMRYICIIASGPSPVALILVIQGKGSTSWEELGAEW